MRLVRPETESSRLSLLPGRLNGPVVSGSRISVETSEMIDGGDPASVELLGSACTPSTHRETSLSSLRAEPWPRPLTLRWSGAAAVVPAVDGNGEKRGPVTGFRGSLAVGGLDRGSTSKTMLALLVLAWALLDATGGTDLDLRTSARLSSPLLSDPCLLPRSRAGSGRYDDVRLALSPSMTTSTGPTIVLRLLGREKLRTRRALVVLFLARGCDSTGMIPSSSVSSSRGLMFGMGISTVSFLGDGGAMFWPTRLNRREISLDDRGSRSASRASSEFLRRAAARAGRSVRFGSVGRLWTGAFASVSGGGAGTEDERGRPTDCRTACSFAGSKVLERRGADTGLVARG